MADKPNITPEGYVAKLVRVGVWATPQNPIQYAFLEQKPFYLPNEPGWAPFSAAQRAAVQQAFEMIAEVVNLTFVQVPDNQQVPGPGNPRINFYANSVELSYSGSMDAYQFGGSSAIHGADIRFNTARIAQRQNNEGFNDFTSFVALHEVLHGLGLSHPGDYNGQGYNYQDHAEFVEDTIQYSVMSYFGAAHAGADHVMGNVQYVALTPLLYDILALQSLYAPNMTTRTGDTVYGFNSNTGADSPFNFAVTTGPVVAIWDAGGVDTIDLSGYSSASLIDLNQAAFSDAGGLTRNIAIAFGVTIENAVGGVGDDVLRGNQVANELAGGAGNDLLEGGGGADLLDGGAGIDTLRGGLGDDLYHLDQSGDLVEENAGEGIDTVYVPFAAYTLGANVEGLYGTAAAGGQALTGNGLANLIVGSSGNDVIDGGAGVDDMIGGDGNDIFHVDDLLDRAAGQQGVDEVRTNLASFALGEADGTENLTGTAAGGQSLTGNGLANVITGGNGNDLIDGLGGADTLRGGLGNDIYLVDSAGDSIVENAGEGTDEVRTTLSLYTLGGNLEHLTGTSGAGQTLTGNALANVIIGGGGNDAIDGAAGADSMAGGIGNDTYLVDDGGDTIVENANGGTDEVRTSLAAFSIAGFAHVEALTGIGVNDHILTGNALANAIYGDSGQDRIDGGAGVDLMYGGFGNDIYYVDEQGDVVTEISGGGNDEVRSTAAAYTLTAHVEKLVGLSAAGQSLTGNSLGNYIDGGSGDDVIDGGAGADVMTGGLGNDTFHIDHFNDFASDIGGIDTIATAFGHTLGASFENLTLTGTSEINGTGNGSANVITGNVAINILDGGAGADTMIGSLGNDIYVVDNSGDVVVELAGEGSDDIRTSLASFSLAGVANVEVLVGLGNVDQSLTGNDLDNVINGGLGADTMAGGNGSDAYFVDNAGDSVVEAAGQGVHDSVNTSLAAFSLSANVEDLVGTSSTGQALTGNGLANIINASAGNDVLDGGAGADFLRGGAGDDAYLVDDSGDVVSEFAGEGSDEVRTSLASFSLAGLANVENLTGTSGAGQQLTGDGLANRIAGASGNDLINGGLGADTMSGGLGNDVFIVDNGSDSVTELAGQGNDEVRTALAAYTLGAEIETLTGLSNSGQALTGNGLANAIFGGWGGDLIDGGLGADAMAGSLGNDIYLADNAGDTIIEGAEQGLDEVRTTAASFSLAPFANVENLTGGAADQTLTGNGWNNLIDGGAGADAMAGTGGHDVYIVDNAGDTVTELDGAGTDEVRTSLGSKAAPAYALYVLPNHVENLTGTSAGAQGVRGNASHNVIVMGAGADLIVLDDGGIDSVNGGGGNDFIYYGATLTGADTTNGGAGTDTLGLLGNYASGITFTAANLIGVERLALYTGGGAFSYAVTTSDANVVAGGELFVTAASLTATEILTFNGSAETDGRFTILGGSAGDTVTGGAGSDYVAGNAGADTLSALAGNDFLLGGLGADQLSGGGGHDAFRYDSVAESAAGSVDRILDFTDLDRIDLSRIDANGNGADGDTAFTFIGSNAFTNVAGQLRATEAGGVWTVEGDVNGDGAADLVIQVTITDPTLPMLGASDFFL